jgi:hypothetical protein
MTVTRLPAAAGRLSLGALVACHEHVIALDRHRRRLVDVRRSEAVSDHRAEHPHAGIVRGGSAEHQVGVQQRQRRGEHQRGGKRIRPAQGGVADMDCTVTPHRQRSQ